MENASRRYTYEKVKQMVERQKEKYGWEFLFLGANIDAIEVAGRFGISAERAVNYNCDSVGTEVNYKALSNVVSRVRRCNAKEMAEFVECCEWKEEIEADYRKRGKKDKEA